MEYRELSFSSPTEPVLAEIATLLSTEWSGFTAESLYAKYAGNPHALPGTAHFICVYDGGRLVAANGYIPSRFRIGERVTLGVQDCDSFVRAECRGKGVFSALVRRAEAYFEGLGYDFLFGFPNAFSTGAYEKLGWTDVREVAYEGKPILFGSAGSGRAARGARGGIRVERISLEAAAALESYPAGEGRLELSPAYAAWRFPATRGSYEASLASAPGGDRAWAITGYDTATKALRICALGGATGPARVGLLRALGRQASRPLARIQACAPLDAAELADFRRAGFLPPALMRRIRRSTTKLICRTLGGRDAILASPWRIQYADFDTV